MIKGISVADSKVGLAMRNGKAAYNDLKSRNKAVRYADSFTKHAVTTAPVLLALTALGASIDKSYFQIDYKQAFKQNLKHCFAPFLLITSVFLTYSENRNNKK